MEYSRFDIERLEAEHSNLDSELNRLINRAKEKRLKKLFNTALFIGFGTTVLLKIFEITVPDMLSYTLLGCYVVCLTDIVVRILTSFIKFLDRTTRIIEWLKRRE